MPRISPMDKENLNNELYVLYVNLHYTKQEM